MSRLTLLLCCLMRLQITFAQHLKPGFEKAGIKEFILTGHSQGGGITFLLTSYLENLKVTGKLPSDVRFKTYCSAGPKPGNIPYAYNYENMTQGGWACNADPENPNIWQHYLPTQYLFLAEKL